MLLHWVKAVIWWEAIVSWGGEWELEEEDRDLGEQGLQEFAGDEGGLLGVEEECL